MPDIEKMTFKSTKFKVAAAHAAPVFMDKAATIRKAVQLIEEAAAEGVKMLVFPETFIPGYPVRLVPSTYPTNRSFPIHHSVLVVENNILTLPSPSRSTGSNATRP